MNEDSNIEITEEDREFTWNDVAAYAEEWGLENNMTPDMMIGVLTLGINTYENSYISYSLALEAHKEQDSPEAN